MQKESLGSILFKKERLVIDFSQIGINNLNTLGRVNYLNAHSPLEKHIHKDSIEICYLARGKQAYTVGDQIYTLKGGDVFITFPDEEHSTGINVEEKSVLYYIIIDVRSNLDSFLSFNDEDGEKLAIALDQISKKNRHFKGCNELKVILDEIFLTYYSDKPFKKIAIQSLACRFFIKIIELESNIKQSIPEDISRTISYINENIHSNLELDELALLANLSLSRFKQKFKEVIGIPPGEYILRTKIEESKRLLRDTDRTITEIAHNLGFSSSQYFATVFKKFKNMTPSDFRVRVKKDSKIFDI
ncbi:MAG TPA: AraC family transcriptional regulator [Clostridiaceae bacterium]|nr:AraC family transcriptional regulator [Clostridiaceae bacterium]